MPRARRGALGVTFRDPERPLRVMFAVPRSVGVAVVRNRTRRRLKATLRELVQAGELELNSGEYVLAAWAPIECLTPTDLSDTLKDLIIKVTQP